MDFLIDVIRETISVFLSSAPFLLFGFLMAGVLKVAIPARWLAAALGKRDFRSVLLASLAGIPLPLCSCSVLPTAIALRQSGASKGATVSFLVSTPEIGVDSISLTYALMDPIMTAARPLSAFATALAAGAAVNISSRRETEPARPMADSCDAPACGPPPDAAAPAMPSESEHRIPPDSEVLPSAASRWRRIVSYGYGQLLDDISPWLVTGLLLSGLISALIPDGALSNPALQGLPAMLAMLLIGVPLYVCATSSTPIAAALMMKGLSPGAALVFLLAGPATNATAVTVLTKFLGRRSVAIYLAAIAIVSLAAGAVVNAIYASGKIDAVALSGAGGNLVPSWVEVPAAFVLLALLARSAARVDLLRFWRHGLRRAGRPLGVDLGGPAALRAGVAILLVLYLLTGLSTVGPGEVGWVLTFGRISRTITQPGLVVHWPYPLEVLAKEQPRRIRSINRGYRAEEGLPLVSDRSGSSSIDRELVKEAEIATGDENLLAIRYSVQYHVADPHVYRFGIDDPERLVAAFAESAIRRVLCAEQTDSILVNHRPRLEAEIAAHLQGELSAVGAGVSVLRVDLADVHAPAEVHFSFRDVASAMEDKHRFTHQAESYRAQLLGGARGAAYTTMVGAEGDRLLRVAEAKGRTTGFTALERACRQTREVTRLRLYLDAAQRLLPKGRLVLQLVDLPLDLWVSRGAGRGGPAAFGGTVVTEPGASGALPPGAGASGAPGAAAGGRSGDAAGDRESGETWREKLERLRERER